MKKLRIDVRCTWRAALLAATVGLCAPQAVEGQSFVDPNATSTAPRRSIIVGLPTSRESASGGLIMNPNVSVMPNSYLPRTAAAPQFRAAGLPPTPDVAVQAAVVSQPSLTMPSPVPFESESLPPPEGMIMSDAPTPIFSDLVQESAAPPPSGFRNWWVARNIEGGVGRERLANAPFEIDSSQPLPNFRLRFNRYGDAPFPDRAEYLWAKTGSRGPPLAENKVDYQEVRALMELGTKKFSTATEIPIRWTNPDVNRDHTGLGDMNLTIKTVMVDGKTWQITQLFRTYFSTGSASMGLGTGHISMEPGALLRYKWSDVTFLHGEMKYFFPIGGNPTHSGQIFKYGIGASHVLIDGDNTAWLTTLEATGAYVGNGLQTDRFGGIYDADGQHIFNLYPGIRYVRDCGGDLGLLEIGLSTGIPLSGAQFFGSLFRLDMRWSF